MIAEPVVKLGKIATVGVVTFSSDLAIDNGYIQFGPADGELSMKAPIDVSDPEHKTYLLGLKQSKDYAFQVVLSAAGSTCSSAAQTFTTGTLTNAPTVTKSGTGGTKGFIVGSDGLGAGFGGGGGGGGGGANLFIFDTDGDVVWASAGPPGSSRARLDWDAKFMWGMALNVGAGQGRMDRISVDGETVESNIAALSGGHHDFTVLPGGHVAVIAWITPASNQGCTEILDYDPVAKTAKKLVSNVNTLYKTVSDCHTNAITYQENTKTFIVSDRNPNLYVKFSETGEPIWQLGGNNAIAPQLTGDGQSWQVNHGHMLTDDGRFVLFNNGSGGQSTVREFQIDEAAGTATVGKNITDGSSMVLGDVQVLSNDNLWVTYSTASSMKEYDTTGKSIAEYKVGVGYSYFTPDLYAKPVNK